MWSRAIHRYKTTSYEVRERYADYSRNVQDNIGDCRRRLFNTVTMVRDLGRPTEASTGMSGAAAANRTDHTDSGFYARRNEPYDAHIPTVRTFCYVKMQAPFRIVPMPSGRRDAAG